MWLAVVSPVLYLFHLVVSFNRVHQFCRAAIVGRNKREREWETPPYDSTVAGAAAEEHPDAPPARRRRLTVRTTITSMHHDPHIGAPAIESRAGSFN